MHAFSIFSLVALGALTTAIPHGGHVHKHAHLARSPIPAPALEVRDLGACGGDAGSCPDGYCCSQYGYCGKSAAYCGNGCQSAFGTCNANASPSEDSAAATSVELQNNGKPFDPPQSYGSGGESWGAATTTTTLAASTSAAPTSTSEAAPSSYSAPAATSSAPSTDGSSGSDSGSDSYTVYTGDGSTGAGWPSEDQWVDFDSMWSANMAYISISCAQFGMADNSDSESEHLKTAIQDVASASGVDARFVLAVTMQESKGCVRAPTTAYSHANPGLMQSHDGTGSCNGADGVQDPCPQDAITQQIQDGTEGTAAGDGLKQLLAQAGGSGAETYYTAARMYNSGSVDASGDLGKGVATHCYASDIANRLTGWVTATTTCNL